MQLPSLVSALRQRAAKVAALTLLSAVVGSRAVGMSRPLVRRQASPLQAALQEVLAGDAAKHILAVEESVRPTYEALPKNAQGQIPPEDVFPAVVRSYFAKVGSSVCGSERPRGTPSSLCDACARPPCPSSSDRLLLCDFPSTRQLRRAMVGITLYNFGFRSLFE